MNVQRDLMGVQESVLTPLAPSIATVPRATPASVADV